MLPEFTIPHACNYNTVDQAYEPTIFEMSQQNTTSTKSNQEDNENAIANRLILGLAAHPLSSCNPPPPELPDLLDSLIASEARLEEQIAAIEHAGKGLVRRINDVQFRVQRLRAANSHLKSNLEEGDKDAQSERLVQRRIFEAKERVFSKMWIQIIFVHFMFTQKIRGMTISTIKAHRDIFAEFLGERHNHPGIQVANSLTLSCAPGCDWYQKHGPYEWSKKPYSNAWLEEMNNTDWDWLRIKEHIAAAIEVGGGKVISMFQMLQSNSVRFIPGWFWAENFETWTLHGEVEPISSSEGKVENQVTVKVRFNKSAATIQQEKAKKLCEMIKGGFHDPASSDDPVIEIDEVGEMTIDQSFVFDGIASKMAPNGRGQEDVRWLIWWGYEKWYATTMKSRAESQIASKQ